MAMLAAWAASMTIVSWRRSRFPSSTTTGCWVRESCATASTATSWAEVVDGGVAASRAAAVEASAIAIRTNIPSRRSRPMPPSPLLKMPQVYARLSARMVGARDHRMQKTEALFRRSRDPAGAGVTLTLDPGLQGLPGTAHGGSVVAAFDAAASLGGRRRVSGIYRRRVPLGVPLALETTVVRETVACSLREGDVVLVEGHVAPSALPGSVPVAEAFGGVPLPISTT